MRRCMVLDCSNIDRATYLCTLPFIEIDRRVHCTSYSQDKEYLDSLLHIYVRDVIRANGYVPETQKMVNIAKSLNHAPSVKALERRGD